MHRREFLAGAASAAFASLLPRGAQGAVFASQRPAPEARRFRSQAVDALVDRMAGVLDPELGWMFGNCFPNTLDTTVFAKEKDGRPDTYVITGDIDAMWLRDSSAQVHPYLPLCREDPALARMIEGVIRRHTACLQLDPYANAFYDDPTRKSEWHADLTEMKPGVHERKWELDSPCYCMRLAWEYWQATGRLAPFDAGWVETMRTVLEVLRDQQRKTGPGKYRFQRRTERQTDTLAGDGYGHPWRPTGMIASPFRNSDDSAIYLFNVPANLFAVASLRRTAALLEAVPTGRALAPEFRALAAELEAAVQAHGVTTHPTHGRMYVYECDGFGNVALMDDAGLPNLVSLPYLGETPVTDPFYQASRRFALSTDNPYFHKSPIAEGVGSPHLGWGRKIWPLAIVSRALTSTDDAEVREAIATLKRTHAGTGFMHEGFEVDDPTTFTRKWFAWANGLFGELVWKTYRERPNALKG